MVKIMEKPYEQRDDLGVPLFFGKHPYIYDVECRYPPGNYISHRSREVRKIIDSNVPAGRIWDSSVEGIHKEETLKYLDVPGC